MKNFRKYSVAFCGGAYGDEGKGRIVDEYVNQFAKKKRVVLYRDNGGSNAGHTVEFGKTKLALHQLPSGVFVKKATVVLGKCMVIHPGDLLEEIIQVQRMSDGKIAAKILIDEMAVLSLDTHRALEYILLKNWQGGGKGSTGRGISPAYADILLKHPLRMRDLKNWDEEKIRSHYKLYAAWIKGLGGNLSGIEVNSLTGSGSRIVGSEEDFVVKLKRQTKRLCPYIENVFNFLHSAWRDEKGYAFVFEKAQAVGLDPRYGVYPDVTASDTTFGGITSSTEGAIDSFSIEYRTAVIKATYMSSVGVRKIPTLMTSPLADRIREDAHEYGATTKRPRDIAYLDIPALTFFKDVGYVTHLAFTHMDIVYPDTSIKICVAYELRGKKVPYRPDQEYLLKVKPIYEELPTWDRQAIQLAKSYASIPSRAKHYLEYVSKALKLPILIITTGPKREQSIKISN